MSNLIPKKSEALESPPSMVSRLTKRRVQRAGEQALAVGAEIQATEFVANVAMASTHRVIADEIFYSKEFPDYAYRFRRIGDLQAMSAARKVQEMD